MNQTVIPAGLFVAGAATNKQADNPVVLAAGSVADGLARNTQVENQTVLPTGVVPAGASVGTLVENQTVLPTGAFLAGNASITKLYTVAVAPAGSLAGGSATSVKINGPVAGPASGAFAAPGAFTTPNTIYSPAWSGAAVVGGSSIVLVDMRASTEPTYHRFNAGDVMYVLSLSKQAYRQQRVRGVYRFGAQVAYDFGLDRAVPEQYVLGVEEYRARLRQRTTGLRPQAARKLDYLHKLPPSLTAVGALP